MRPGWLLRGLQGHLSRCRTAPPTPSPLPPRPPIPDPKHPPTQTTPPNPTRASTPPDRLPPDRPPLLPTAGQKEQEANNWLEKRYKTDANPALSYDDTVQLALACLQNVLGSDLKADDVEVRRPPAASKA